MMKVVFRTDASLQIGTGHVMRCLTLADALRSTGAEIEFITRSHSGHLNDLIQQKGFVVHELPATHSQNNTSNIEQNERSEYASWLGVTQEQDADETIKVLNDCRPDWLIVDHYALDVCWETMLRPHCNKIMVIDDLADREHDCDLLLDQNLVANYNNRYDDRVPAQSARLLGPQFALLQPEYAEMHPRTPPRTGPIQRIIVYFGGADRHNMTGRVLSAFLDLNRQDIAIDAVINPRSLHAAAIKQQARDHTNITLHETIPCLASLMLKADLAIGASGATSWERVCLGLPSLVITLAENQIPIAAELNRLGLVRWLGHFDAVSESKLKQALLDVLQEETLEQWSRNCMTLVNGKGAERVAQIISLTTNTPLKSRLARLDDEALLLHWANDPLVRQNAFNPEPISAETHRSWFYQRLRNPEGCKIYIIETEEGLPIGQVRFENKKGQWEIHYGLDPVARKRKLGKKLLQIAIEAFRYSMSSALLFGRVKQDNLPSQRVFEDLGFNAESGGGRLSIAICSDAKSWINEYVPELLLKWLVDGHQCVWTHKADNLSGGDICFYLSYGRIVKRDVRCKYRNNLVVHASDLPKGRGWSPASWMILEGKKSIPVTLLEAVDEVDAGPIYSKVWFDLDTADLVQDWRNKLATVTVQLVLSFVDDYPGVIETAKPKLGEPSYYPRRGPEDSVLDVEQSIARQFNLLRIVDNEKYPAFFTMEGKDFILKIYERYPKKQLGFYYGDDD